MSSRGSDSSLARLLLESSPLGMLGVLPPELRTAVLLLLAPAGVSCMLSTSRVWRDLVDDDTPFFRRLFDVHFPAPYAQSELMRLLWARAVWDPPPAAGGGASVRVRFFGMFRRRFIPSGRPCVHRGLSVALNAPGAPRLSTTMVLHTTDEELFAAAAAVLAPLAVSAAQAHTAAPRVAVHAVLGDPEGGGGGGGGDATEHAARCSALAQYMLRDAESVDVWAPGGVPAPDAAAAPHAPPAHIVLLLLHPGALASREFAGTRWAAWARALGIPVFVCVGVSPDLPRRCQLACTEDDVRARRAFVADLCPPNGPYVVFPSFCRAEAPRHFASLAAEEGFFAASEALLDQIALAVGAALLAAQEEADAAEAGDPAPAAECCAGARPRRWLPACEMFVSACLLVRSCLLHAH